MTQRSILEDVGEFLPFARKHQFEGSSPTPLAKPDKTEKVTLAYLWPEPDWSSMRDVSPQALVYLYLVYQNIRKSPRDDHWGISATKWESAYIKSIEILRLLSGYVKTDPDTKKMSEYFLASLKKYFPEFSPDAKHINDCYHRFATGTSNSRKRINSAFSFDQRDLLQQKWLIRYGWPANPVATKYRYFPVKATNGSWLVVTATKRSYEWLKEDEGLTEHEAIQRAHTRNNTDYPPKEIDTSNPEEKHEFRRDIYSPKKKSVLSDARIGPIYRTGDVTAEELMKVFGFRGVQFGNSLLPSERQQWVNDAYDAFCDLSDLLCFKRHWIGLGGVGLAFGARGIGGASAHFEPHLNITNLTRNSGAGSFAHEFFHALDYRIGNNLWPGQYLTANLIHCYTYPDIYIGCNHISKIESLIPICKLIGGFSHFDSNYFRCSYKLAFQHGAKKYWIQPIELFARAFESYIQDKLISQGRLSPWLVHGTLESDCPVGRETMWPYPVAAERLSINNHFEIFVKTLLTK